MRSNNLNIEQKERLKKIGLELRNVRTVQNISLDTVAANTKIAKRLLLAIEEGDFAELPEPFYIQAFVTKFAREIGAPGIKFTLSSSPDAEISHRSNAVKPSPFYLPDFELRSLHLYLLYVFLIIISVRGITLLVERPVIINELPEEQPVETVVEPVEPVEPSVQPKSQAVPQFVSQSSDSDSVTVGINLQERCWLKVMVDGKVAFEGVLPQGTQRQWTGDKEVTIKAGNAGGVVISFNNQQQKVLGAPGEVEEITYTVN